jgi:hypothetical protein
METLGRIWDQMKGTAYFTHDNGGRPYKVVITKDTFAVYRPCKTELHSWGTTYTGAYLTEVIAPTKYNKVFIGRDKSLGKDFDGNSVLVNVSGNAYVFIGHEVCGMIIDDEIIEYKSPVGNSDVPYPYAIGKNNTYLFLDYVFTPNKSCNGNSIDPYIQYYDNGDMYTNMTDAENSKISKPLNFPE